MMRLENAKSKTAPLCALLLVLAALITPAYLRVSAHDENAQPAESNESFKKSKLKLNYALSMSTPANHLYEVRVRVEDNNENALDFAMPAWSPGRYVIYNFARNVQGFGARAVNGETLAWSKIDKQTWRVECRGQRAIEISYKVYANDLSGTFSQLNDKHANFNGASLFMYLVGRKDLPITLKVEKPKNWKIMSGAADNGDQTEFRFDNYDLLIDTPAEIGNFDLDSFTHGGREYRIVLHQLVPLNDRARLVASIKKIVEAQTRIFGTPDFKHYTFLLHHAPRATETDGMEHLNSTQVIETSLEDLIATSSHEFFHLWNVKRIRPVELGPWDYSREVHTKSLWISEGLTSYYGDLTLARAGVWPRTRFYQALAREIQTLEERPGRKLMSLEQSSWDTWLFLATPKAQLTNHDNTTISYYNKGEIVGLMLDLEIRARTASRKSLDDVFRYLYEEYYQRARAENYYLKGRGFAAGDFLRAVNKVTGLDFTAFFNAYVSGTQEIDYNRFLEHAGLQLERSNFEIKESVNAKPAQIELRNAWLN